MSKDLKKILSESAGVSGEMQQQITEVWEAKMNEARAEITATLREEFAKKFEHDKQVFVESMDSFLTDKIRVELEEFAEDKRALAEERVAYKSKVKEHTDLLNKFIVNQVAKEVKELRADKVRMNENVKQLENFLLKQLSEEIREFRSDKRELMEQKVKMVKEGKQHLAETKAKFVKRAAQVVESSINKALRNEMSQFKDDIKVARENDFGRRIFESFVGEYLTSYLNEGTEVSKLQKVLESKEQQIAALAEESKSKEKMLESLNSKLNVAKDRISRDKVMAGLLAPLSKDKKAVMNELLESVQTKDLEKAFNKYLPAVLNESAPKAKNQASRPLVESSKLSEKTGNRAPAKALQESQSHELDELKILAGLK